MEKQKQLLEGYLRFELDTINGKVQLKAVHAEIFRKITYYLEHHTINNKLIQESQLSEFEIYLEQIKKE